jgi:hypothetical protein
MRTVVPGYRSLPVPCMTDSVTAAALCTVVHPYNSQMTSCPQKRIKANIGREELASSAGSPLLALMMALTLLSLSLITRSLAICVSIRV